MIIRYSNATTYEYVTSLGYDYSDDKWGYLHREINECGCKYTDIGHTRNFIVDDYFRYCFAMYVVSVFKDKGYDSLIEACKANYINNIGKEEELEYDECY